MESTPSHLYRTQTVDDDDDDDDWSQYDTFENEDEGNTSHADKKSPPTQQFTGIPTTFPPQLHPAVSLGVQRVSSCYFSLASEESIAELLSQLGEDHNLPEEGDSFSSWHLDHHSSDILYHDILMSVFTFLDESSLAAFSETARRPNFEVFYFLQLQLQRAVLVDKDSDEAESDEEVNMENSHHDALSAIAGSSCLSRLARIDPLEAQCVVDDYLGSNSTLRTMPLSHSLAYMRHVLHRHGFHNQIPKTSPSQALASAAVLMGIVGAASMIGSGEAVLDVTSFGSEIPNMLFGVGFVGSLMGAARKISDTEQRASMRETAEHMARSVQELPSKLRGTAAAAQAPNFHLPSLEELKQRLTATIRTQILLKRDPSLPLLANPYDHLQSIVENKEDLKSENDSGGAVNDVILEEDTETKDPIVVERKKTSGCVGAYTRAVRKAKRLVANKMKERRKARFASLSPLQQRQRSVAFLDACSTDDLPVVQEMIHSFDVDGFFSTSEGSDNCALHSAAFHGANKVLDFLCRGIDDKNPKLDGGLCDVDCRDTNGWTALHFAAGTNSVDAVRVLAGHGASLDVEANNGYSPLLWASRLSNEDASVALQELLTTHASHRKSWISSEPLSSIANRFFALIPTN